MISAVNRMAGADYSRYLVVESLDEENLGRAKDTFGSYRKRGVITGGTFDDDVWSVTDEKSRTQIRFDYSDAVYEEHAGRWMGCTAECYREAAKAYVIFKMGTRTLGALRELATHFREIAAADFPGEDGFGESSGQVLDLLLLLPGTCEEREAAIEILEEYVETRQFPGCGNQRKLLDFPAYFRFHDAITEFWACASHEEKLYFFPLYLWWILTAILPLRVTEFLLTPRDCLVEKDGRYLINVRRTKLKGGGATLAYRISSDYIMKTYPVSDDIAGEILWYQDSVRGMEMPVIDSLFRMEPYKRRHHVSTNEIYNYRCLNTTKQDFDRSVLHKKGIPTVKLGETRHIAMMNLVISGGSPRMCMELAGHVNIGISSHYYSNMAALVECATYELYRKCRKGPAAMINGSSVYSLQSRESLTEVPGGWCCSENRKHMSAEDCVLSVNALGELGDCRSCRYFSTDRQGVHLDFYDTERSRDKVNADSWFLMHMIEAVRQGLGYEEDMRQAILRLQTSCRYYQESLLRHYEEESYGQTEKDEQ